MLCNGIRFGFGGNFWAIGNKNHFLAVLGNNIRVIVFPRFLSGFNWFLRLKKLMVKGFYNVFRFVQVCWKANLWRSIHVIKPYWRWPPYIGGNLATHSLIIFLFIIAYYCITNPESWIFERVIFFLSAFGTPSLYNCHVVSGLLRKPGSRWFGVIWNKALLIIGIKWVNEKFTRLVKQWKLFEQHRNKV